MSYPVPFELTDELAAIVEDVLEHACSTSGSKFPARVRLSDVGRALEQVRAARHAAFLARTGVQTSALEEAR